MDELQYISDRLGKLLRRLPADFCCEAVGIRDDLEKVIRVGRDSKRVADSSFCEYCKVEFRGWNYEQRFCSRRCQGHWVWEERQRKMADACQET